MSVLAARVEQPKLCYYAKEMEAANRNGLKQWPIYPLQASESAPWQYLIAFFNYITLSGIFKSIPFFHPLKEEIPSYFKQRHEKERERERE